METAYAVLGFIQAALPTVGIVILFAAVGLVLLRGPDGQRILIDWAQRLFDFFLPKRAGVVERYQHRIARRATLANFERDWTAKQVLRAQWRRQLH